MKETPQQRAERKATWIARCTAHIDNKRIRKEASDMFEESNPIINNQTSMAESTNKPKVVGVEKILEKYVYKQWWLFSWYETVSSDRIANDIVIKSKTRIRRIVLNDEVVFVDKDY